MLIYTVYTNLDTPVIVGKFATRKEAADFCKRNKYMFGTLFIKSERIK